MVLVDFALDVWTGDLQGHGIAIRPLWKLVSLTKQTSFASLVLSYLLRELIDVANHPSIKTPKPGGMKWSFSIEDLRSLHCWVGVSLTSPNINGVSTL